MNIRNMDYLIRRNLPIVWPFPLNTFVSRFLQKISILVGDVALRALYLVRRSKARKVGYSNRGNVILKLNSNSALGLKGSEIHVPNDRLFPGRICRYGEWDTSDVAFLLAGLDMNPNSLMLDIGANSGLVSLQVLNKAKYPSSCILVEPVPSHVQAIENNLGELKAIHDISIYEIALSDRDGTGEIYIQYTNRGNTSLLSEVVPSKKMSSVIINLQSSHSFAQNHMTNFKHIILKCDTQGMDAVILSRFPPTVWASISRAVVEIWAVEAIAQSDVDTLMELWGRFRSVTWSGGTDLLTLSEVRDFWLSKSGHHKNLLLSM